MKNGVLPAKNALAEYSRSNYNDSGPWSSLNTSRGEILIKYRPETDFRGMQVDTTFEDTVVSKGGLMK